MKHALRHAISITVMLLTAVSPLLTPAPARATTTTSTRVAVIVLENTLYSKVVGKTADAPYINSLISQGKLFTNYHAVIKGSLRNYLAMTAGRTDKPGKNAFPNLFASLDASGKTWTELEESMGDNCGVLSSGVVPGTSIKLYTRQHDPAYQLKNNESCKTNDVPMTSDPSASPNFLYIVPNQCDDGHTFPSGGDCPAYFGTNHGSSKLAVADAWVSHVASALLAQTGTTVILTFDESTTGTSQQVATVVAGAGVTPGTDGNYYDHYSLLAGLWTYYALAGTAPGNAATATPLPIP